MQLTSPAKRRSSALVLSIQSVGLSDVCLWSDSLRLHHSFGCESESTSRKKNEPRSQCNVYVCILLWKSPAHWVLGLSNLPFNVGLSVTRHFQGKNSLYLNLNIPNLILNPTTCFLCPSLMVVLCLSVTRETYASNSTVVGDMKGKTQYITAALVHTEINCWTRWVEMRSVARIQHYCSFYGFFRQNSNLILGGRFKFTIYINIFSAFSPFSEVVA